MQTVPSGKRLGDNAIYLVVVAIALFIRRDVFLRKDDAINLVVVAAALLADGLGVGRVRRDVESDERIHLVSWL